MGRAVSGGKGREGGPGRERRSAGTRGQSGTPSIQPRKRSGKSLFGSGGERRREVGGHLGAQGGGRGCSLFVQQRDLEQMGELASGHGVDDGRDGKGEGRQRRGGREVNSWQAPGGAWPPGTLQPSPTPCVACHPHSWAPLCSCTGQARPSALRPAASAGLPGLTCPLALHRLCCWSVWLAPLSCGPGAKASTGHRAPPIPTRRRLTHGPRGG